MRRSPFARSYLWAVSVLIVSLGMTWGAWVGAQASERQELRNYFDYRVRDAVSRIEQRLRTYEQVLRGGRQFLDCRPVTRKAFAHYVGGLELGRYYPGIQGVGVSLIIRPADLEAHVQSVRADGFPQYRVWPEGPREIYSSIVFLEPFRERNLRAFGYDMFSEPVRQEAMARARDQNVAAVSGKVRLVQETNVAPQAGFLMYVPIYRPGETEDPGTVEARRERVLGWVYAPFRMNDLMEGVLGERGRDLDLEVYDGESLTPDTLMFKQGDEVAADTGSQLESQQHLDLGGHTWTVKVRAPASLRERVGPTRSSLVPAFGLVVGVLLTLLTWALASGRERALEMAQDRETRFKLLMHEANDIVLLVAGDRTIAEANARAAEAYGYPTDALTRLSMPELQAPEATGSGDSPFDVCLGEGSAQGEEMHRHRDGRTFPVEVSARRVTLGGKTYVFIIARNIEDRKRKEEALQQSITESRRLQEELVQRQAELETLNSELADRVLRSVDEMRAKDQLMMTQSRQAAMGEMIGNIAHQWRQPLNTLSLMMANLEDAHAAGELDDGEMTRRVTRANGIIQKLSRTIDDFRNFFKPGKEKVAFSAREQVNEAITLLDASLKSSFITLQVNAPDDFTLFGFPNEYSQALLAVVTNARQAIVEAHVSNGRIDITLSSEGGFGVVSVRDNGGGIKEDAVSRIFEPYFTTRERGTGVGLYMAKQIVEQGMNGTITGTNVAGGALFVVRVPLAAATQQAPSRRPTAHPLST